MKKILVMGGGEFHDYTGCCEVMARQLKELPEYEVEVSINELDKLKRGVIDQYDIIVFYWTKDHLTEEQKQGLLSWCAEKGKFVGVHCATTAFRDCPEYEALLGGRFRKHPPYREYFVTVKTEHPAMRYFETVQVPRCPPTMFSASSTQAFLSSRPGRSLKELFSWPSLPGV